MKDSKEIPKFRSSSHTQLLVFPKNTEYIMDDPKEYLKDKTRKEKFSLESLHEKWKRKGKVNFKNIDFKFDTKRTRPVMTEYKTEEDQRQQKKFFDILHGLHYNSSKKDEIEINKSAKNDMKNNMNNKYENKSYYLSTKMPWNNNSVFDDKDRNDLNKKIKENIKKVRIKNEIIMNKNKSYKTLKERFVKNSFLIKEAKKNKFIEEETKKLYKKIKFENPGLEKYPEKINALIFKEMKSRQKKVIAYLSKVSGDDLQTKIKQKNLNENQIWDLFNSTGFLTEKEKKLKEALIKNEIIMNKRKENIMNQIHDKEKNIDRAQTEKDLENLIEKEKRLMKKMDQDTRVKLITQYLINKREDLRNELLERDRKVDNFMRNKTGLIHKKRQSKWLK